MKTVITLLIGLIIGAGIMFLYNQSSEQSLLETQLSLQNQLNAVALTSQEFEETQEAREKFKKLIKDSDRILLRTRGSRISKGVALGRIKNYSTMRDSLHRTKPSQGKELGGGVGFGIDAIRTLLDDIVKENAYIDSNTDPKDSLKITGIRAHFSLKNGISDGHYVDYLDVILTPSTIKGEAVYEWVSQLKDLGNPPPLDDSNPCPDTCP